MPDDENVVGVSPYELRSSQESAPLRITKISVKELFYTFNHNIDLKLDGRITIIHGLNGLGKTTLLRMVKSLCGGRYRDFLTIPFGELRIEFDNTTAVSIEKSQATTEDRSPAKKKRQNRLFLRYFIGGKEAETFRPQFGQESKPSREAIEWFDRHVDGLHRIETGRWHYAITGESMDFDDLLDRFGEYMPDSLIRTTSESPQWLMALKGKINVRLIETQRLMRANIPGIRLASNAPAIAMHSNDLAERISRKESEYGSLSQTLDRTFPIRYVEQRNAQSMSNEELRERFQRLELKRRRLEEAGLLGKEKTGFVLPSDMDDSTRGVMSIYVTDIENKLGVFDELAKRIDLFRKIINDHFMYKELRVSKNKGFRFFSRRTGDELDSKDLSSGEQHEVVLLYELLFQVSSNSFIMIDEPEISLHIAWQEEFLHDLHQIISLSPFDAVIATHSPQIVNDRWDLTVELTGPSEVAG